MLGRRRGRHRRIAGWLLCGLGCLGLLVTVPMRAWLALVAGALVLAGWSLLAQS